MSYVKVETIEEGIDVLTLSAPERLNAISGAGVDELLSAIDSAERDISARVIVITGAGRGFCAGLDLSQANLQEGLEETGAAFQGLVSSKQRWGAVIPKLRSCRIPIIAAVNGPAVGAGLSLALGADIRIASTEATFTTGYQKLGISAAEMGLSWILPRLVGLGRATEMCLTGRTVRAEEAERIGLVTGLIAPDELLDAVVGVAKAISRHTPLGLWLTKDSLNAGADAGLSTAVEFEVRSQLLAVSTEDAKEMRRAGREKRPAVYSGR